MEMLISHTQHEMAHLQDLTEDDDQIGRSYAWSEHKALINHCNCQKKIIGKKIQKSAVLL